MWHYFPRGPLKNRVLKTRFIIQKHFKNLPSPKHDLTSPDRIRLERESDQREGDQIRERERVRSERERKRSREPAQAVRPGAWVTQAARPRSRQPGSCGPGRRARATQAARPRSCEPGFISSSSFFFSF